MAKKPRMKGTKFTAAHKDPAPPLPKKSKTFRAPRKITAPASPISKAPVKAKKSSGGRKPPEPRRIKLRPAGEYAPSLSWMRGIYGSDAEIRKEYRRLQYAIDKRIKRAEAAGYGATAQVQAMRSIVRISELESMQEIVYRLNKAYRYLSNDKYTLKGIRESRKQATQTMIERGLLEKGALEGEVDTLFAVARKRGFIEKYTSEQIAAAYRNRQASGGKTDLNQKQWNVVLSTLGRKIGARETV